MLVANFPRLIGLLAHQLRATLMNTEQSKKEAGALPGQRAGSGPLMTPDSAAEYLGGIVKGTLAKWRHFGGPRIRPHRFTHHV